MKGKPKTESKLQEPVEGAWYGVPLEGGDFGVMLLARFTKNGTPLGYFFGPRRKSLDAIKVKNLRQEDAAMVRRFAESGIRDGSWPLLRESTMWSRSTWPVPLFRRQDRFDDEAEGKLDWVIQYDDDLVEEISERRTQKGKVTGLQPDSIAGALSIQRQLSERLKE